MTMFAVLSRTVTMTVAVTAVLLAGLLSPGPAAARQERRVDEAVHHRLTVRLYPDERRFAACDVLRVPQALVPEFTFFLHPGLNPAAVTAGVKIRPNPLAGNSETRSAYTVTLPVGGNTVELTFGGVLYHPLDAGPAGYSRGGSRTAGLISGQGVFLAGSSCWYPVVESAFLTFALQADVPRGWEAVSQGRRSRHEHDGSTTRVRWESPEPQEEIYLVASALTEYGRPVGSVQAMAFLRAPDQQLAATYLDATVRYLQFYQDLIGAYPYKKFALVENFWETGFGMPSFTLLGPTVLRFPFIVDSSYPHEILHSWWGNAVFPGDAGGNWCEGLTAYLADHLMKQRQGKAVEYRQTTLQKYADYVSRTRDFPLSRFRFRHSAPSEAVGYGKALMLFHMLRMQLGDQAFIAGLRELYRTKKFSRASFRDVQRSFEAVSGSDLRAFFTQWVERAGAPALAVSDVEARRDEDGHVLKFVLEQTQPDAPYSLRVPVAVTVEGTAGAVQQTVTMRARRCEVDLRLPGEALRLDVDPEYDLFRRLQLRETPPAVSQALGADKLLIVLPSCARGPLLEAYRRLAAALKAAGPGRAEVLLDNRMRDLPSDRAVAVLGWENGFASQALAFVAGYGVSRDAGILHVAGKIIPLEDHSVVLVGRNPANGHMAVMLVAADRGRALPGLGRKLPHYHKYSYLGFEGPEPANMLKGRFPVTDSPLAVCLEAGARRAPLAPRRALAPGPEGKRSGTRGMSAGHTSGPAAAQTP